MHGDGAIDLRTFPRLSRLLIELETRNRHIWIQDEILDILSDARGRRYSFAHVSSIISAPNWVRDSELHIWIQDEILDFLVQISILSDARIRRYSFAHVSSIISAPNWVTDSESSYLDSGRNFGLFGLDFNFVRCTGMVL